MQRAPADGTASFAADDGKVFAGDFHPPRAAVYDSGLRSFYNRKRFG
jgi:hypothetical protein